MEEKLYDILIKSFDSELTEEEKIEFQKAMESEEFRNQKLEIENLRKDLGSLNFDFPENFEDQVLEKINSQEAKIIEHDFNRSLFSVFKKVATISVAAVLIFIVSIYLKQGSISLDSISGIDQVDYTNISSLILYEY